MSYFYIRALCCIFLFSLLPIQLEAVVLRCEYVDETTGEIVENPTEPEIDSPPETESAETIAPMQLSELYPAPVSGQEEFIELYNPNAQAISIAGLKLTDASGKSFTISEATVASTSIGAGSYLSLPYNTTKITLNNSGDTVVLTDTSGTLLDQTTYGSALSGFSWSRRFTATDPEMSWAFTSLVTPASMNLFSGDDTEAEATTVTEQSETTQPTPIGGQQTAPTEDQPSTADAPTDTRQTSEKIKINELFPNAIGSDTNAEWIEIVNTGDSAVRLIDWTVSDAAKTYPIGDISLGAGELLLLESSATKISLNNSGETITLTDPFDASIDSVTYGASTEGQSYARFRDGFSWTAKPTPGSANALVKASAVETKKIETAPTSVQKVAVSSKTTTPQNTKTADDVSAAQKTTIAAAKILADGAEVAVSGVVAALPGQLGTQYFFLQDASGGVQIYSYAKLFPDLKLGDRVTVSGELGTSRGTKRVKITQASDIVVTSSGEVVAAKLVSELDETVEGMLAQTSSVLAEKSGLNWSLDNGVAVGLKASANVSNKDFKEGDAVTVIGIVEQSGGAYRIAPRQVDDVRKGGNDGDAQAGEAGSSDGIATTSTDENDANGNGVSIKKVSGNTIRGENTSESTGSALLTYVKNHPWVTAVIFLAIGGIFLYVIRRNWKVLEQQEWVKKLLLNPRIATLVEWAKIKGWLPLETESKNDVALNFQRTEQPAARTHHAPIQPLFQSSEPEVIDDAGVFYALSDQFRRGA